MESCFVAFDVETTGVSPKRERIVEIGAVKYQGSVIIEEFESLINPLMPIPAILTATVHGISDKMVEKAPTIAEILPKLMKFIGNSPIIAHNADFDIRFLNVALATIGYPAFSNGIKDTVKISRKAFPGLKQYNLKFLTETLGLVSNCHRALADARACGELYLRCLEVTARTEQ